MVAKIKPRFHEDCNAIDSGKNSTLLHHALGKGYVPIVKELIAMGAIVNSQDSFSMTPLHLASQERHVEVMDALLENGASLDATDSNFRTPLHYTCEDGFVEGTKQLLEKGANASKLDSSGLSPSRIALDDDNIEICELLLDKVPELVNQVLDEKSGDYPIHVASRGGNEEMVKFLLRKGANLTLTNGKGNSPIQSAVLSGHYKVLKLMLQKQPNLVKERDKDKRSLLYLATMIGKVQMIKEILTYNPDVNAQTDNKTTPLHKACEKGFKNTAKLLIGNNASPNLMDYRGCTPLHQAVISKRTEVVEILVQSKKCNLSIRNKNGKTALDLALEDSQFEIVKILSNEIQKLLDNTEHKKEQNVQKENSNECVICFEPKNGIFALQPCGHARTCEKCSKNIIERSDPCPSCRKEAKQYQKIFL